MAACTTGHDGQPAASPNTNQSPNGPVQKEANQ
jgi:hypothetical protein